MSNTGAVHGNTVKVTAHIGLNIRSTPGIKSDNKIGAAPDGTVLQATGKTKSQGGYQWDQVNLGHGKTGWMASNWLTKVNAPPTVGIDQYVANSTGSTQGPKTTMTSFVPPPGRGGLPSSVPYSQDINQAAAKYGIDPALVAAVIKQESGFNPKAVSSAGAIGLGQLMPGTASGLGVNPWDPQQNIDGTAHYLANQLHAFGGNVTLAIAAYNAGPGAVQQYHGVPPYAQTQNYVQVVSANYQYYQGLEKPQTVTYA
ncbi:MAG: transglycosylase SLT domain-containing protein [Methylacidiphilaceae bacterium]|nr:transglycosylase SLT domain-containing protein [Candidatus Methylacidiphilaceae bacterium]